jgi:hypothetical protein
MVTISALLPPAIEVMATLPLVSVTCALTLETSDCRSIWPFRI